MKESTRHCQPQENEGDDTDKGREGEGGATASSTAGLQGHGAAVCEVAGREADDVCRAMKFVRA